MVIVYVLAGLKTVNKVLAESVIPGIKGFKKSKELGPRNCGELGTLALTDEELEQLRDATERPRQLHEFYERMQK